MGRHQALHASSCQKQKSRCGVLCLEQVTLLSTQERGGWCPMWLLHRINAADEVMPASLRAVTCAGSQPISGSTHSMCVAPERRNPCVNESRFCGMYEPVDLWTMKRPS